MTIIDIDSAIRLVFEKSTKDWGPRKDHPPAAVDISNPKVKQIWDYVVDKYGPFGKNEWARAVMILTRAAAKRGVGKNVLFKRSAA